MKILDSERAILDKLRKIEALYAGAATEGERSAAGAARERIRARLREFEQREPVEEWRFSIDNPWSRRLLTALARRYGLTPYRRSGQKRTTVMLSAPRSFIQQTLIPEFNACNDALVQHLDALAARIIAEAIASDTSEAGER